MDIFTIGAKNYIPQVKVLTKSFLEHVPNGKVHFLLIDKLDRKIEGEFRIYEVDILRNKIPQFESFLFKYKIVELATAVKPFFFEYLFESGLEKVFFFDPDIMFFNDVSFLEDILEKYSVVLTPHITKPIKYDGKLPDERIILKTGIFNLGFIGIKNNEIGRNLIQWWKERTFDFCINDIDKGFFVDQKWIDFVPIFYNQVFILKDPGFNVSYWNLQEREITKEGDYFFVNGKPLYFFHFSGYDPERPHEISKYQNRYKMSQIGKARILYDIYRKELEKNLYSEFKKEKWYYGFFENGEKIEDFMRKEYWLLGKFKDKFLNPFKTGKGTFYEYLCKKYKLNKKRLIFKNYFSNTFLVKIKFLIKLVKNQGLYSLLQYFYDTFYLNPYLRPIVRFLKEPIKKILRFFKIEKPKKSTISLNKLSVNVFGFLNSEKGTGESSRSIIRALNSLNLPYKVFNINEKWSKNKEKIKIMESKNINPKINIFCFNADISDKMSLVFKEYFSGDYYKIGYWVWELEDFPQTWEERFKLFDEIWVPSNFVAAAISLKSPKPVIKIPHNLEIKYPQKKFNRQEFGIPKDAFVFGFIFDFYSYLERKNPLDLINVFKDTFNKRENVYLIIKTSGSDFNPKGLALIKELSQDHNIIIVDSIWSKEEVFAFYKDIQVYVSLHRAEGFGFTLAEAMSFGLPVIATGYSGNLEFMNDLNSFLVRYELIKIQEDVGPYKKGNFWAQPDLEHAKFLLRYVYENYQEAKKKGTLAKVYILNNFSPRKIGERILTRLESIINFQ